VESQVREYIRESRASACVVNTAAVIGAATEIVKSKDANILIENGGYLERMGSEVDDQNGFSEEKREHCC